MTECLLDRDGAVREVTQVYELIKTRQPLLLLLNAGDQSPTVQLAQSLLNEALRALNVALSSMKLHQSQPPPSPAAAIIKVEPQVSSTSPTNSTGNSRASDGKRVKRAGAKRRTEEDKSSWVNMTTIPHEDGYQWRKYGEKKIKGTHFTRSYFRCTFRDDNGCPATKQIQQKDNRDQPMFQVTYSNEHTCSCTTRAAANSSSLAMLGYCNTAGVKQEAPADMQSAAGVYSDQTPAPQDAPFPCVNNVTVATTASAAGSWCSDISGMSFCDEPDLQHTGHNTDMVMGPMGVQEDLFCDPELLLLYDSFNYY